MSNWFYLYTSIDIKYEATRRNILCELLRETWIHSYIVDWVEKIYNTINNSLNINFETVEIQGTDFNSKHS